MWRPHGESAIVVSFDGPLRLANASARAATAAGAGRDDVSEVVCGARAVLVRLRDDADPEVVAAALRDAPPQPDAEAREHRIEVAYDGDDLAAIADETGLAPRDVVALHSAPTYTVALLGFLPGFAYLMGLAPALMLPRLRTPRTHVPAGSVAIAGEWSGIYPSNSPGGWRLLGRTGVRLFDPAVDPPVLLAPGDRVRFVAT